MARSCGLALPCYVYEVGDLARRFGWLTIRFRARLLVERIRALGPVLVFVFVASGLAACSGGSGASPAPAPSSFAEGPQNGLCPTGAFACGSICTNLANDAANCGRCGAACGAGAVCVNGTCTPTCQPGASCGQSTPPACPAGASCNPNTMMIGNAGCAGGTVQCGTSCVDTQTDTANCGHCGATCPPGGVCNAGQCACPNGGALCGTSCVDVGTDHDNCGGCGKACTGGTTCTSGTCGCTSGKTECSGQCVDTSQDVANCGGCNQPCTNGQTCSGGSCQAPSSDGCNGTALDVSISQIAVYEAVKIPIMTNGTAVDASMRNADVVEGHDAVFRVFVHPEAGWVPRVLSARVTMTNGATQNQYTSKNTVMTDSTDADLSTTFQVAVPASDMQANATYSVELVECGTGTGTAASPRFPATGQAELGARQTGPLKIVLVPVLTNGRTPDTSDPIVAMYESMMTAMYPITGITMTVGSSITTPYPIDWSSMLDQIRSARQSDGPPSDVYYYGVVTPTNSIEEYCTPSCTAGIGYVAGPNDAADRAAVGLAFGDEDSVEAMAHEVGHNHGRNHAPCSPGPISGVDPNYPYANGLIGSWGYDSRSQKYYDPSRTTDIMGYCNTRWISDYTYEGLVDRVATVNGASELIEDANLVATYRVLIVDGRGSRWGLPFVRAEMPFGAPEPADVLDATGKAITTTTVYRTAMSDSDASTVLVKPPETGWKAVRVKGAAALAF